MARLEDFRLPDVGEGLTEGEILTWYVAVGDTVVVNQTIVEVETAKAAVELPCPYAGRVAALHVAAGETVDVGTPIITIDTEPDTADAPEVPPPLAEFVPSAAGPKREAVLVGYGVREASVHRRPRRPAGGSTRPGKSSFAAINPASVKA